MIDARRWQRPSPAELAAMIPPSLSKVDIAERLGLDYRRVRYWFQAVGNVPVSKRIGFCEWYTLKDLIAEETSR